MFIIHYKCLIVKTFFNFYGFGGNSSLQFTRRLDTALSSYSHSVHYCVITALPRRGILNGL